MYNCPHCGAEINANARACPECGSDEATGWSDRTYLDGIDLPDEEAYEEIKNNEFGDGEKKKGGPYGRLWIWVTGIVVLAVFVLGMMKGCGVGK
jgi:hypothetical protein